MSLTVTHEMDGEWRLESVLEGRSIDRVLWTVSLGSPLQWIGIAFQIAGCILLAAHVDFSRWAYPLLFAGGVAWLIWALRAGNIALAIQQGVFTVINVVGIWRWLS